MKPKLAIWGASGHAMVVADIIRRCDEYHLAGFLDDVNPERRGSCFFGAPILGGREQLDELLQQNIRHIIFGFGNNDMRLQLAEFVRKHGFKLATAIDPRAMIASDVPVGEGTVIKAGSVIDPGVRIGANVYIGAKTSIAHEATFEDGASMSAGADVGKCSIGRASFIGISATVKPGVNVGRRALIGAGAVVVRDIPDESVAYGVPARVHRKRDPEQQ